MTSADSDRYGLRPRLATLMAMRPPGSSTRRHSANTSSSIARYSRYELGMPPSPSAVSYALPAKYGGDVTTSATDGVRDRAQVATVAAEQLVDHRARVDDVVVGEHRRR